MSSNHKRETEYKPKPLSLSGAGWWVLTFMATVTFSIMTWAGCNYLFNFPENPKNFKILKKVGRIGAGPNFEKADIPTSRTATPEDLYELFYALEDEKISNLNQMLLRGYITQYADLPPYRYLSGEFRILESRPLTPDDFVFPGVLVKAQAFVNSADGELSSSYPLTIDYLVPTEAQNTQKNFQPGDLLEVKKKPHYFSIVHVQKEGPKEETVFNCVVLPISCGVYTTPDRQRIVLSPPQDINIQAPLPLK